MGLIHELNAAGVTAADIRSAVEAAGHLPLRADGTLTSETDGRGGTIIADNPTRHLVTDVRIGMVTNKGPNGEGDYKGAQYWILSFTPIDGGGNKSVEWGHDGSLDDRYITATHIFEAVADTHYLEPGSLVLFFSPTTTAGQDVYLCVGNIRINVLVAVTGFTPTDDNGHYDTATITYGPGTGSACVVDNSNEAAWQVPGVVHKIHLLPVGWQGAGILYGTTTDTPPKPKVRVSGQVGLDVLLTTDGGANASTATGTATYTYTVKSHYGNTLLTGASPQWARPVGILTGPATKGYLQIDTGGNLLLAFTDEQAALTDCTT